MVHVQRVYDDVLAYYNSPTAKTPRSIAPAPPNRLGITPINILKRQYAATAKEVGGGDTFHPLSNVKGLYLYGGVGCGKTYLMDILFNELPTTKKRRVHFHQFMMEVHRSMHEVRQRGRTEEAQIDIIDEVAMRIVRDAEVLCFDEIVVADIGDAMIMRRLFIAFFKIGVVVFFTSNRHPDDLYKGGMNRDSFVPFIRMVKERCIVYDMQSDTDYRLSGKSANTYLCPVNSDTTAKFSQMFLDLTKGLAPQEVRLQVFGRDVVVPHAVGRVCKFSFADLCGQALSPADYTVIAKRFHTVFISNVPTFNVASSDNKRRFITLLDTFYQYKVKIVVLAEAEPHQLQRSVTDNEEMRLIQGSHTTEFGQIINSEEESFQMQRTVSRLIEMQSVQYLQSKHHGEDVDLGTN